ncbi:MAG: S8 family serine peptidase, partial [Ignavibacteriales bacterium]|nr:S8 family serine peptidase [Ignavibacteriales bacterium]
MRGSRALLFAFALVALVRAQTTPTSYIVKYRESVPLSAISSGGADALTGEAGRALAEATTVPLVAGDAASDPRLGRIVVAELERPLSKEALDLIAADPAVEYAYQSRALKIDEIPNDSLADEQWALAKIDALTAWKTTRGEGIVVAVIDTGIDYLHPDVADNVRVNEGETGRDGAGRDRRENGIDDDGNGYIDDWIGYDFVHREGFPDDPDAGDFRDWDNDPYDENSHGSAVAGIIAAIADNEIGVAGVAPNARILGVRAFDPEGYGDEEDAAAAIVYAVQAGADVINMSFGDDFFSLVLRDVARYAAERGVTLVASSGNDGTDAPHYPSGFDGVISVGNSTSRDYVALNSSHGSTLDLVAPGSEIMTLDLGGGYRFVSGTSAAAPHVSAVAAALLSVGDFTPEEIRQILKTTSDDVLEPGWDDRSGAGRLNFAKAVGSQAPAAIRFHAPAQDYASRGEILDVRATILAPMFRSFDLDFGVGDNPATWTALVEDRRRQASDEIITRLDLTSHSDTVYTLRILVTLTNGRTLEERVNFRVAAHAPLVEPIGFGPAYLADRPTIIAALFTDQPAAVRMRYRLVGEGAWRSVSLDGFSLGAIHVRNFHYGYAPVEEIEPGAEYEIFFEAENLAGLVGSAKRESGDPFVVETAPLQTPRPAEDAGFSLPPGTPFPYAFTLGDGKRTAAVFEVSEEGAATVFYDFENGAFASRGDSLAGLILKEIGDFDGDGLKDALAFAGYRGRLLEQTAPGSSKFVEKYDSGEDRFFWPIMARDIDGDGAVEVVAFESDTSMSVFSISGDLELTRETTVYNFSEDAFGNSFNAARALLIDADEDGFNELWVADIDGDVMRYEVRAKDDVRNMDVVESGFFGSSNFLAAGDFNGDGTLDVAALFESIDEIDVAPYNRLLIYNIVDGELHSVYDYAFLDETRDFRSYQATNALEFADLDADGDDELIGFFFPHAYVFDWRADGTRIVFHEDGVASSSVLASDFDADGALEVALPKSDEIVFREFFQPDAPPAPVDCRGYSVDSATVRVEWRGAADRYRLLKGDAPNALVVIDTVLADSTQTGAYLDGDATIGETYYYAVRSEIDSLADPLSLPSNVAEAYHHVPGTLVAARAETPRAVRVT